MRMLPRSRASFGLMLVALLLLGSVALLSSTKSPEVTRRMAAAATSSSSNYVRPGVQLKINSTQLSLTGNVSVNFSLTDPDGVPLDYLGVQTPGPVSLKFVLAYLPQSKPDAEYIPVTLTANTSVAGKSVTQPGFDAGGLLTANNDGTYTYLYNAVLPVPITQQYVATVGITATRTLTEFDLGTDYANAAGPVAGTGSGTGAARQVVTTADCNACHSQIAFHGGSRQSMDLCVLCHVGGYVNPQTGNSIDLKVMIHKIHMGSSLPSVIAGTPYQINGVHGNNDYSAIVFPAGANRCVICHAADAAQAASYKTYPTRDACGACHDNVNFATGLNHGPLALAQADDTQVRQPATCRRAHPISTTPSSART